MLALLAAQAGCDQGPSDIESARGPALHLVASYPADGQGTNADPAADVNYNTPTPDCPVPTDVAIELRFDRFLLPGGALTQGIYLYSGNPPANGVALSVAYDLIERVLVLHPARDLHPNTLYTVEIPPSTKLSQGVWAFDHAPLEAGAVPLRFSFSTGSGPSVHPAEVVPAPDTCDTIAQGALSTCAGCHVTTPADGSTPKLSPPMGLDLSSARGLYYTAVSHVAHQTETADSIASVGVQTPVRFGEQMNIVDPGNPATSYLLYKLLQKPENFRLGPDEATCTIPYHSPVAEGGCTPPDPAEINRLREWFVHGEPMPKDGQSTTGAVLPAATNHTTLLRLARWIASGALCAPPP